ncbi:MAG: catechol 2,3-dioxygenase [Gammaproteobacteria bacterium]|nr:catechol 2,3-dioxygenase [Gammaproteobacteria bacterium]MBU1602716.1 catechol 2,3-dioxygenase [Gammaproteobacteria bacterium]MBU2433521.1 catechol 2,3-dioxygenase [Gammaproteobacteria bacterium]MBU2451437.1 catechol 2,3-dioxygenase [Gammaproteobacteria bacterium]
MAMTGVLRPGHAQIRVLDLEEGVRHYRDVLGLVETGRDAQGRVYLKCWDERDHSSVILREADRAGIDFFAFKVLDKATLDKLEADLQAYGVSTERIPAGELLETGERVRFEIPSGHKIELYAEKKAVGNGLQVLNPAPWTKASENGIAPVRLDHCLLYGPNIAAVQKLFTEVLGFYLVERVLTPDGAGNVAIWLSCSHKVHDIAFVEHAEPGKLHHLSFLLESWDEVLRAADIMSMNNVPIDIGPTRHGITRGCTIYAWDPSGNRFETFMGGYQPYPDYEMTTWSFDGLGSGGGLDYPQRKLHETFLSVVT